MTDVVEVVSGRQTTVSVLGAYDAAALVQNAFATRAEFVSQRLAITPVSGMVRFAGGYAYRYIGSGTAITDLPGWVPDKLATAAHFGADLTGGVSANAAVNLLVAYVNSIGGGIAKLTAGTYRWTGIGFNALGINNVVLEGEGVATKILRTENSVRTALAFVNGTNNRIRNLLLDCDGYGGNGIALFDQNSGIENCYIYNCPDRPIRMVGGSMSIPGTDIAGRIEGDAGWTGVSVFFPQRCWATGNTIKNCGRTAISQKGMPYSTIRENYIEDSYSEGVTADACNYSVIDGNTLVRVSSINPTQFPDKENPGSYLGGVGGGIGGMGIDSPVGVRIVNNTIIGVQTTTVIVNDRTLGAIRLKGSADACVIQGNQIKNSKIGVLLKDGVGTSLSGNHIILSNIFETIGTAEGTPGAGSPWGDVWITDIEYSDNTVVLNEKINGILRVSADPDVNDIQLDRGGFTSRSAFVTWIAGNRPAQGAIIFASGEAYRYTGTGTVIPDLPGYIPVGASKLEMFGAIGDGATNDQTAWANALAYGNQIFLTAGKRYLVTDTRALGVQVIGPGRVVLAISGGTTQVSSQRPLQSWDFRDKLFSVQKKIFAGTPLKVVIVGSSVATNDATNITNLVRDQLERMGIQVAAVDNKAVAGSGFNSGATVVVDFVTGAGAPYDLVIIAYGQNEAGVDGAGNPDTTALRNAAFTNLANLRATAGCTIDDLSVLLMMPTVMENSPTNSPYRNRLWLEAIQYTYRDFGEAYGCAIFNPYLESASGIGIITDISGTPARALDAFAVHPLPSMKVTTWGRMLNGAFETYASIGYGRTLNIPSSVRYAPDATGGLALYNYGTSLYRGQVSDNWPIHGLVITDRQAEGLAQQTIVDYQLTYPLAYVRHWVTQGNAWSNWSGAKDSQVLSLQNSWVSYGGSLGIPTAQRTADGFVALSGVMKNGTVTTGTTLFTLPVGYAPATERYVNAVRYVAASPETTLLRIQANGVVTCIRNTDTLFLGLDGIGFFAA